MSVDGSHRRHYFRLPQGRCALCSIPLQKQRERLFIRKTALLIVVGKGGERVVPHPGGCAAGQSLLHARRLISEATVFTRRCLSRGALHYVLDPAYRFRRGRDIFCRFRIPRPCGNLLYLSEAVLQHLLRRQEDLVKSRIFVDAVRHPEEPGSVVYLHVYALQVCVRDAGRDIFSYQPHDFV